MFTGRNFEDEIQRGALKRVINPVSDLVATASDIVAPGSGTYLKSALKTNQIYDFSGDVSESVKVWTGESLFDKAKNWVNGLFNKKGE